MSMSYTEWEEFYKSLLPPRTHANSPFNSPVVSAWARMKDAVAQLKLNGSRNLVVIDPKDNIIFRTRDQSARDNYPIPEVLLKQIRVMDYPHGHWNIFDSELMHFQTTNVKNSVYFFDTLVWKSEYLLGSNYTERFGLVQPLVQEHFPLDFTELDGKIWIADNFPPTDWASWWSKVQTVKAIEGLVLKRTGAGSRLVTSGGKEYNNDGFMCRIRKPFKNAQH